MAGPWSVRQPLLLASACVSSARLRTPWSSGASTSSSVLASTYSMRSRWHSISHSISLPCVRSSLAAVTPHSRCGFFASAPTHESSGTTNRRGARCAIDREASHEGRSDIRSVTFDADCRSHDQPELPILRRSVRRPPRRHRAEAKPSECPRHAALVPLPNVRAPRRDTSRDESPLGPGARP